MKKQFFKIRRSVLAFAAAAAILCGTQFSQAAQLPRELVPVGRTAGIKLFAGGVAVESVGPVQTSEGSASPAEEAGLLPGDLILSAGGCQVDENAELQKALSGRDGMPTELKVLRSGAELRLTVVPLKCADGATRIGATVRDSMAGIGTITYYDPGTQTFGALGHGICSSGTGQVFPLAGGSLVPSAVTGVVKGSAGSPGELLGVFESGRSCGSLTANTERGLFGKLDSDELYPRELSAEAIPVGGGVEKGKAVILSNISGSEVREFEVEIVKTVNFDRATKNILFRVCDPVLLEATGGIVQGMSGSPIIQNGRLVGAVTHVMVNDPTMGYGILIENMLSAQAECCEPAAA